MHLHPLFAGVESLLFGLAFRVFLHQSTDQPTANQATNLNNRYGMILPGRAEANTQQYLTITITYLPGTRLRGVPSS